jgi:hypothetical protein
MAGTVVTGNIGTEEILSDEKKLDFDEAFKKLRPDETQFTTMTDRAGSRIAIREKVNWFEEDLFPRIVSAAAAALVGDATFTVVAGQGKILQPNDLLRNMRTGEGLRVTSVTVDAIGIARGIGSGAGAAPGAVAAAAINSGDMFLVVGDAQPQGADFPVPRYIQRVLGFNYTEIFRTPWSFTGTAAAIEYFGGREPAKEGVRKLVEHKRKLEASGFFGMRSFTAAVAPENEPLGTCGGLLEFIPASNKKDAGQLALTPDFFDKFLMDSLPYGSPTDKVLFASPIVALNMSKWNRAGMGSQWKPEASNVHGVAVDAFISGAYGYQIPVVVKREWSEFPYANKGYGGYAFLADMSLIERRPLRDRDTKVLNDRQPRGKDTVASEVLTEMTWQIAVPQAHGLLVGVDTLP